MNLFIVLILIIILFFSVKGSIAHFKGEGSCCGGGGKDIKVKPQKLSEVRSTKIVKIDGMHCEHCYARVHNVLNSIEGVNASVKGKRGIAIVRSEYEIDDKFLADTIEKLGYKVISIESR